MNFNERVISKVTTRLQFKNITYQLITLGANMNRILVDNLNAFVRKGSARYIV